MRRRPRNDAQWRRECLAARGYGCRAAGAGYGPCKGPVQVDHVMPRAQGGPSVVENGLPLCEEHHGMKTASRLRFDRAMLDADQVLWLAERRWVNWDDAGEPYGRGYRHFDPIRPLLTETEWRSMADDEDQVQEQDEGEGAQVLSLGEVARAAMGGVAGEHGVQEQFDGMDFTKVRFVGMAYDSLDHDFKIGDEATFTVRARCTGVGDEAMRDGHVRHIVKMDVLGVAMPDEE